MSKILHIDSSSRSATSITRLLSKYLADKLQSSRPGSQIKYRDLVQEGLPYVSELRITTMYTPPNLRSPEQQQLWLSVEEQVDEVINADTYVFGVPMYNFSVPAAFKAFIDSIVVPGKTFSYENGIPKPLLLNKKAFVITASGGTYDSPPMDKFDFLEPYLRAIFGFTGVSDITFIKAAGHSEEEIKNAVAAAKRQIDSVVAQAQATQTAAVV